MTLFRKLSKKMGINLGSFNVFMDYCCNPRNHSPHYKLFQAYDRSLQNLNNMEERIDCYIRLNLNKPTFEQGLKAKSLKQKALEKDCIAKLEAIFKSFRLSTVK